MNQNELVGKIRDLHENKYGGISGDEVAIYLLEENLKVLGQLDKGTQRLNLYTKALLGLTVVLAVLAAAQIYLFLRG